jgi:hypothetical protein
MTKYPTGCGGGARWENTRPLNSTQLSYADFQAACTERGWTATPVSERVLKLTKRGSVLIASAHPAGYAETLERVCDADAFAMRHHRP